MVQSRGRQSCPTWLRNLTSNIFLNFNEIRPGERRSVAAVREIVVETLKRRGDDIDVPEERQMARMLADVRKFEDQADKNRQKKILPLSENYPKDPDDILYLQKLGALEYSHNIRKHARYVSARSIPGRRPAVANEPPADGTDSMSVESIDMDIDTHTDTNTDDSRLPIPGSTPGQPFTQEELDFAMEIKGLLGYPGHFRFDEDGSPKFVYGRNRWKLPFVKDDFSISYLDGETVCIKEGARRRQYAEINDEYVFDASDILAVLACLPYTEVPENPFNDGRLDVSWIVNKERDIKPYGLVVNSILTSGENINELNQLQVLVESYAAFGDHVYRESALKIINDLLGLENIHPTWRYHVLDTDTRNRYISPSDLVIDMSRILRARDYIEFFDHHGSYISDVENGYDKSTQFGAYHDSELIVRDAQDRPCWLKVNWEQAVTLGIVESRNIQDLMTREAFTVNCVGCRGIYVTLAAVSRSFLDVYSSNSQMPNDLRSLDSLELIEAVCEYWTETTDPSDMFFEVSGIASRMLSHRYSEDVTEPEMLAIRRYLLDVDERFTLIANEFEKELEASYEADQEGQI